MADTLLAELVSFRVDEPLAQRIDTLRREKHLNISSYARDVLVAALDRDYPTPMPPEELSRAVSRS